MTDEFVRHLVSAIATIIAAVIFYAGYISGKHFLL
jgi:hypothetical protein